MLTARNANYDSGCIHVENLNLWYSESHALKDICLNVPRGSITALIGPSGCGKSTFLRTLNRMHDQNELVRIEGDVRYQNQNIFDPHIDVSALRKEIGMVFQTPNPFKMSIYDNVAYGPKIQGIRKREQLDSIVIQALKDAFLYDEVADRLDQSASALSGGQKQRLCIARALAAFKMSIYDNVAYGPKIQGIRKREQLDSIVIQALKDAFLYDEVADRLDQSASALSGGQKQRLCIARALAANPKVILMDEPTSALDPVSTHKVEELILSLKEKYTIVIVTHNMQQAARISDYTAFFLNGSLVEFSRTKEMFENAKDERTQNYISGRFG